MTRDMELIRELLLRLEEAPTGFAGLSSLEGRSDSEVGYNLHLLYQAGLVEGSVTTSMGDDGPRISAQRLTWEGHDFLEAIKTPSVWRKVRERLKPLDGVAFAVIKALAVEESKKLLGMP